MKSHYDEDGMVRCCVDDCCGPGSYCCRHAEPHSHGVRLMGEPKLDPAYAIEMTGRERDALMQADDWSWMLERFFVMEYPVGDRSYES